MNKQVRPNSILPAAGITAAGILLVAASVFSSGAPSRKTGAPGDQTCNTVGCHNTFTLNSGDGSVEITAPAEYTPGTPIDVSVNVEHPTQTRFGFQITARDASDQFVGTWLIGTTEEFADNDPEYVTHNNAVSATASHSWTIQWEPPSAGAGDITFYAAGNAANGNGNNLGDFIYTTTALVSEASGTAVEGEEVPSTFRVTSVFPNPVVDRTTIEYELMRSASVTLDVYDSAGRLVKTVEAGTKAPGAHSLGVSLGELTGGLYVYRLTSSAGSESGKILVIR